MNDLVSVIVAVYNGEKYIKKCIQSILNQTYKNIELIVIDDGSSDKSFKILEDIKKTDNRLKSIHISNSGVSIARNIGILKASGKYISFIDADDYIEPKYIENLYINMAPKKLLIGNYKSYFEGSKKSESSDIKEESISSSNGLRNIFLPIYFGKYNPIVVWGKMYDLEIIKKNKIEFNQELKKYEDGMFNYEYLHYCEELQIVNSKDYIYRVSNSSTVCKYNKDENEDEKIFNIILKIVNKYNEKSFFEKELQICKITLMLGVYKNNILHKENSLNFKNKIKKLRAKYKKNKIIIRNSDKKMLTKNQKKVLFLLQYKLEFILLLF